MGKKKKEETVGQEFKNTLEFIFKYKVDIKKRINGDKYISIPKLRERYIKSRVTEEIYKNQMSKIMPQVSKKEVEMLAQIIFRPTPEDLARGN